MPGAKKPPSKGRAFAPKGAKKPAPKSAKPKPAPKAAKAKPAAKPKVPAPPFVKEASPAARKAAMETLARDLPSSARPPAPAAPVASAEAAEPGAEEPEFVREASPAARKAVVEALAQDAGVAPILARAPWRKMTPTEPPPAPPTATPAPVAQPATPLRMSKPPEATPAPRVGVSEKRPVILDTNALMMQFQFHIDIEREMRRLLDFAHEIVVPTIVVEELKVLAGEAKGKDAGEARMALDLAQSFRILDSPGDGDTGILRLAEKLGNAIVVTNDKVLRARLRAKDIPNVYMRSSAFLTVEGHISGI